MPQARTAGSSPTNPSTRKTSSARPAAGRPAAAKAAGAKAGAAKPAAAKRAAAKPAASKGAAAKPTASRSTGGSTASKPGAKATASKPAAKSTASKPAAKAAAAKTGRGRTSSAKPAAGKASASKNGAAAKSSPRVTIRVNAENVQVEAIAERLRKLNEKIIEFGREAGESTLTSYEKALKAIANGVAHSPAKDELDWITQLAASQAKFVREITDSWAKAARDRLK